MFGPLATSVVERVSASVIFFANNLLLAVYFIFILDSRNDVRQKVNSSDFLIRIQNAL